jgi:hypothetical protein
MERCQSYLILACFFLTLSPLFKGIKLYFFVLEELFILQTFTHSMICWRHCQLLFKTLLDILRAICNEIQVNIFDKSMQFIVLHCDCVNSNRVVSIIHGGRNYLTTSCGNTDDIVPLLSPLSSVFVNMFIHYSFKDILSISDDIVSNDRINY